MAVTYRYLDIIQPYVSWLWECGIYLKPVACPIEKMWQVGFDMETKILQMCKTIPTVNAFRSNQTMEEKPDEINYKI